MNNKNRACNHCGTFDCQMCNEMDQCNDCGEVLCTSCSSWLCEECTMICESLLLSPECCRNNGLNKEMIASIVSAWIVHVVFLVGCYFVPLVSRLTPFKPLLTNQMRNDVLWRIVICLYPLKSYWNFLIKIDCCQQNDNQSIFDSRLDNS